jgi:hypothetical protein
MRSFHLIFPRAIANNMLNVSWYFPKKWLAVRLWDSNMLEGGDKVISQRIRFSLMSTLAVTYNTKMKPCKKGETG